MLEIMLWMNKEIYDSTRNGSEDRDRARRQAAWIEEQYPPENGKSVEPPLPSRPSRLPSRVLMSFVGRISAKTAVYSRLAKAHARTTG